MDEHMEPQLPEGGGEEPGGDGFLAGWEDTPPGAAPEEGAETGAGEETPESPEWEQAVPEEETASPLPRQELEMRADILEFARTFPEAAADPAAIPPQIWAEVGRGRSLTAAYARWALGQERARTAAAEQHSETLERARRNAARSTGSMQTAGDGHLRKDPFLEGWED